MSFGIKSEISFLQDKLLSLETTLGVFYTPDTPTSFNVKNNLNRLTNKASFLQNYMITTLGYIPPVSSSTGFHISNQLNSVEKIINNMDNYVSSPPFKTVWNITANDNITINSVGGPTYDYTIDWGDGTVETNQTGSANHTYTSTAIFNVVITGLFPLVGIHDIKLIKILSFNDTFTSLTGSFSGCAGLTSVNTIGLTSVTACDFAWDGCTVLTTFNAIGLTSVTNCFDAWGSTGLTTFDASGLTSVTNCGGAWAGCTDLTTFDASGLTSVTNCNFAWGGCTVLTTFNAIGLTSVTNCNYAWRGCTGLTTFDTTGAFSLVTTCVNAWENCTSLASFTENGLTNAALSTPANKTNAFTNTPSPTDVTVLPFVPP